MQKLIGVNYMEIIKSHKKISKPVKKRHLKKIIGISFEMIAFCQNPKGNFREILAMAHSQIEKRKPLRFFVTSEGKIVINPKIINHTKHTVDSLEGCVTFPDELSITVQRWNKCVVEFQTLDKNNKLTAYLTQDISGQRAKMFQHCIDILDAIYIYE